MEIKYKYYRHNLIARKLSISNKLLILYWCVLCLEYGIEGNVTSDLTTSAWETLVIISIECG